jgi:hypothetical protein
MGSGRVSLLSGQIRRYRVGLPALRGCVPTVCWAAQAARGRRPAGPSRFWPNRLGKIENPLSFSNLLYKFQANLNSNQI